MTQDARRKEKLQVILAGNKGVNGRIGQEIMVQIFPAGSGHTRGLGLGVQSF